MKNITALRMERQHLSNPAIQAEYDALYRDMQPGLNVYWNGFGDPPTLMYRAAFDDMEYNRTRQRDRTLLKGRFAGGNLGWVVPQDLALFAGLWMKPLTRPTPAQTIIKELIEREGPLNIHQMKESTGLKIKEITPALHRLQEAFLVYEDQHDGEWDRGWYRFEEMFPHINVQQFSRQEALCIVLQRFAFRHVLFDAKMAKSFFKLPEKEINTAIASLVNEDTLVAVEDGFMLKDDCDKLRDYTDMPTKSVFALHRNDFLVKSNEHWLKERFTHAWPDTLYYLLIDGEIGGAVAGKFRYTPEVEDVWVENKEYADATRRDEILQAVRVLCGNEVPIRRFMGVEI